MNTLVVRSQLGDFSISLNSEHAPITCGYFSRLALGGALNDSSVFRILADGNQAADDLYPIRIVQIGPTQSFSGDRHPIEHEGTNLTGLAHTKWSVSAARFDLGELYGSFFICMRDEPELDYGGGRQADGQGFAVFGRITAGFETVKQLYRLAESDEMLTQRIAVHSVSLNNTATEVKSGDHHDK